jgi:branched-chain amino acid transport system ATP-binding protein
VPVLSCSGIVLFLGGRPILSGVGLEMGAGEIFGIAGPNGAGKTSLFDVLSGRYRAHRGRVELNGRDVTDLPTFARARLGIGRTFQTPIVPDSLTVHEVLESARKAWKPKLSGLDAEWARTLVRLHAPDAAVSGTLETLERRKLLLAAIVMRRPSVLLLDEPASGMVTSEIDELDAVIKEIAWEYGIAVAVVEHRLELLASICDRVMVMDVGKTIAEGPAEEVFAHPAVRAAYFEESRA